MPDDELEPWSEDDWSSEMLGEDPEETWFDAAKLEEASAVEVGAAARTLLEPIHQHELLEAERHLTINAGRLPGWAGGPETGHGWGDALTQLAGGLRPGQLWLLEGQRQGAFVHALLRQLADGFALRTAGPLELDEPATPAVLLVREGRAETTRRSVARMTGEDLRLFQHGARAHQFGPWSDEDLARAHAAARRILDGPLAAARHHLRVVPGEPPVRGVALVDLLEQALGHWAGTHPLRWPVLLLDDVDRLAEPTDGGPLPFLARLRERAQAAGWIVIAGCIEAPARAGDWVDVRIGIEQDLATQELQARVRQHHEGVASGAPARFRFRSETGRCEPIESTGP